MVIKIQKTIEIFILFCFILLFVPHAGIVQVVVADAENAAQKHG
jgi:hypothetical protein